MNGYGFFKSLGSFLKKIIKPLLAIVAAISLQFYILPALAGAGPVGFVGFGAFAASEPITAAVISGISAGTANVISTGRPKAFLSGFGQGVLTFGIGKAFPVLPCECSTSVKAARFAERTIAHAVVGGAFAEVNGDRFTSGFLAAGFTNAVSAFAPKLGVDLHDPVQGTAFSAVSGGVSSILGGGKFADGLVTGAYVYLLNHLASQPRSEFGYRACVIGLLNCEKYAERLYDLGYEADAFQLRQNCFIRFNECVYTQDLVQSNPKVEGGITVFPPLPKGDESKAGVVIHRRGRPAIYKPPVGDPLDGIPRTPANDNKKG